MEAEDLIGTIVENENGNISRETEEKYEKMLGCEVRFLMNGYCYTQEFKMGRVNLKLDNERKVLSVSRG